MSAVAFQFASINCIRTCEMVAFLFSMRFHLQCNFLSGKVTFSWKSLATAYAVLFYAVTTVIVVIVGRERLEVLQTTKKFDDKIYAIVFVIFLVPHFWIPFVGWGKCQDCARTKIGRSTSPQFVLGKSDIFSIPYAQN